VKSMERLELKEVQKLEGHTDRVWSLDWNPATGHAGIPLVFASCSGDKTVRIWEQNLSTNLFSCKVPLSFSYCNHFSIFMYMDCINTFEIHILIVWCQFHYDGLMKLEFKNEMQATLEETHTRTVRSCAWSPSGKLLATASFDATTAIWENVGGEFECVSTLEVCYCHAVNIVFLFLLSIWMCVFFDCCYSFGQYV